MCIHPIRFKKGGYMPIPSDAFELRLRSNYFVYSDENGYFCSNVSNKGVEYSYYYSNEQIENSYDDIKGKMITNKEAANILSRRAIEEQWRYFYGYQLDFEVQRILLILVAQGRAKYEKIGRNYVYKIS
jgi:hypothetical protein